MPKDNIPLYAFNRGIISRLGLARVDLKRMALSASDQTNWMPRVLGSMMLRPGWEMINQTYQDHKATHIPFIYASDDTAIIELTENVMRVEVDEEIITRPSVSTTVSNGDFNTNLTGWTDADESGSTSTWATGGYMSLVGNKYTYAIRKQTLTVSVGDQGDVHALRIVVNQGRLILRVGTSDGGDQLINETVLTAGTHSLTFTPTTGSVYLYLAAQTKYPTLVDSINIEAAGAMTIPTPYAEEDLAYVRYDQSADVIYLACDGYANYKIERRSPTSWSFVRYLPEDGPFRSPNITPIRLTPSALIGTITLTASKPLFRSGHVGALFKITSIGQTVTASLTGDGQATGEIRVTGVGAQRTFQIIIAGTWAGTLTIQRSVGEPGAWVDVADTPGNANQPYTDGLDNQIIYYRYTFKTGGYTSGQADIILVYSSGSLTGIARVTAYTSETQVTAIVLQDMGSTSASEDWSEGEWSDYRGYPTALALYEGRLWWAGKSKIQGSISDAYESFDDEQEGASAPLNRSIGQGPVDTINWLLPLQRLILGTDMREVSARSSSFDEPLTVDNFNLKDPSTQGSSPIAALKIDTKGAFVGKSGDKLYQLALSETTTSYDYESGDLTRFNPEIGESGFINLAIQRQPDTRIHAVLGNGQVAVLVSQPEEEVMCWILVETNGVVEDIVVLPGENEDKVYYQVAREVNGVTKRFRERWAMERECRGGTLNKQADCFTIYQGAATATVPVAHLEGCEVIAWADGKDFSPLDDDGNPTTFTVTGGNITLPQAVSNAVVGLHYQARFRSTKLAYAAGGATALTQRKKVDHIGVILCDTHAKGLRYGQSYDNLDEMPGVEDGAVVPYDTVWDEYDKDSFEFPGEYNTDSRMCLVADAPRPVTVLAAVVSIKTNDKG